MGPGLTYDGYTISCRACQAREAGERAEASARRDPHVGEAENLLRAASCPSPFQPSPPPRLHSGRPLRHRAFRAQPLPAELHRRALLRDRLQRPRRPGEARHHVRLLDGQHRLNRAEQQVRSRHLGLPLARHVKARPLPPRAEVRHHLQRGGGARRRGELLPCPRRQVHRGAGGVLHALERGLRQRAAAPPS